MKKVIKPKNCKLMKTKQKLINEFSIEELERRFEMKPWVVKVCTGPQCPIDQF